MLYIQLLFRYKKMIASEYIKQGAINNQWINAASNQLFNNKN